MNKTQVIYKVALKNGLYVSDYEADLMSIGNEVYLTSNGLIRVSVTPEIQKSENIPYKNVAIEIAKYVKGLVVEYKLGVYSIKREIIADYRGGNNDPQTS